MQLNPDEKLNFLELAWLGPQVTYNLSYSI